MLSFSSGCQVALREIPREAGLAGKNINGEATVEQSLESVKGNF